MKDISNSELRKYIADNHRETLRIVKVVNHNSTTMKDVLVDLSNYIKLLGTEMTNLRRETHDELIIAVKDKLNITDVLKYGIKWLAIGLISLGLGAGGVEVIKLIVGVV